MWKGVFGQRSPQGYDRLYTFYKTNECRRKGYKIPPRVNVNHIKMCAWWNHFLKESYAKVWMIFSDAWKIKYAYSLHIIFLSTFKFKILRTICHGRNNGHFISSMDQRFAQRGNRSYRSAIHKGWLIRRNNDKDLQIKQNIFLLKQDSKMSSFQVNSLPVLNK